MPARVPEPISISFFARGWVPNRQPLYSALTFIGINPVQFHDMAWDGINMEYTDQLTLRRRPPFVKYCTQQLAVGEIVNEFYSTRDLSDNITVYADTNQRLLNVTPTTLTSVLAKGTAGQGFVCQVGNMTYYANGTDLIKIDNLGNVSAWGIAAPTVPPVLNTGSFWKAGAVYASNAVIEDPNGNVELVAAGGGSSSGTIEPLWPAPILSSTQDGGLTWLNCGPIGSWTASTVYSVRNVILDTNGNIQICTTAGTSGATAPTWSSSTITTDGSVTWTYFGYGSPLAFSNYAWVYAYRTYYGELSTASDPSNFTGPILGPQRVSITALSMTGGVVTFTGSNNFVAGSVFEVLGLVNAPYLNGSSFTVLASGLTTSVFKASMTQAQINAATNAGQNTGTSIIDTGYTLSAITTLNGEGALTANGSQNPLCNSVATISSVAVNNNIVTCTVSGYSPVSSVFSPGIWVTLAGLNTSPTGIGNILNGQQVQVRSASATQFTFIFNTPNYGPSSDTGTATFNAIEIYRTADGGGIYYFDGAVVNPLPSTYDSGAVIAGLGTGGLWTNPNNVTQTGGSYATIAVTEGSGALTFTKVQSASGSAQYSGPVGGNQSFGAGSFSQTGGTGLNWGDNDGAGNPSDNPIVWSICHTFNGTGAQGPDNTLLFVNFGFGIPIGATINGVVATINRNTGAFGYQGSVHDNLVQLIVAGVAQGDNNAATGTLWPTVATDAVYGNSGYTWSVALTPALVNDSANFGLAVNTACNSGPAGPCINNVTLTVYYTVPGSAPTSCTATFGSSVTGGNTILVCAQGRDGAPSVSDGVNTYNIIATSGNMRVFAAYGVTAGATTVTATFPGNNGGLLLVDEVSGIVSASQVDVSGTSTASAASGSVTTANANDAICSFLLADVSPSFTVPSGYTSLGTVSIQESDSVYGIAGSFLQVSSTGNYNPTWSSSGTALNGVTVAFKIAVLGLSGPLTANTFNLNVPFGVIQGIKIGFHAKTSSVAAPCTVSAQLLRNGSPIGNVKTTANLTTGDVAYTFGSSSNLLSDWGVPWNYFNFNNSGFGVRITVTVGAGTPGSYTFSVNDVTTEVFASVSAWSFVDSVPDSQLVTELIAPLGDINDPPPGAIGSTVPTGGQMIVYWNGRIWMAVGNKVYFSAGPDTSNGVPESCWPPTYFFTFPGNVKGLKVITGGVVVAVADAFWSIQGGPQTTAFYPDRYLSHIGVLSPKCLAQDGDTLLAYTSGSQCFEIQAGQRKELGGNPISPVGNVLLNGWITPTVSAARWSPTNTSITVHRNGVDAGIWICNGSDSLIRYGINVDNWSPISQPLLNGFPHAGVIESVETAPGVWTLLLSSNLAHDYIYYRNFAATTFTDNGNAYDASITLGNIILSEPTQMLVPVDFISAYSANIGNVPTVSWLPNEIGGGAPFTVLPLAQNEPVQLATVSKSIMARRWPVIANQTATPLPVRHLQVQLDYGRDTVANELYTLVITPNLPVEIR